MRLRVCWIDIVAIASIGYVDLRFSPAGTALLCARTKILLKDSLLNPPARWRDVSFPADVGAYRKSLWGFLLLVILWSGIRFRDGTVLLAISRGLPPSDPALENFGQWLWDAPLKIGLLRLLPGNAVAIGLAFAALGILPGIGLLSRGHRFLWLTVVTVFLTPAFKVSLQNLGVGDGVLMFLALSICASTDIYLLVVAAFTMALWHPQQSFFVGVSFFVGRFCYYGKIERRQAFAVGGALALGALAYITYKALLPFHFVGRAEFMTQHGQDTLVRNLYLAPVAFAPTFLWMCLLSPRPTRLPWLVIGWLCLLGVVATFTSDVTRVMTITSLPIILTGASKIIDDCSFISTSRIMIVGVLVLLVPPLNWSGLDYFLWPDLIGDLCKWHVYCHGR